MDIDTIIAELKRFSIEVEGKEIILTVPTRKGQVKFNFTNKGTTICTQ